MTRALNYFHEQGVVTPIKCVGPFATGVKMRSEGQAQDGQGVFLESVNGQGQISLNNQFLWPSTSYRTVAYPEGGGFGCSNTPLSAQLINYSLLIRLAATEALVQAAPGCVAAAAVE